MALQSIECFTERSLEYSTDEQWALVWSWEKTLVTYLCFVPLSLDDWQPWSVCITKKTIKASLKAFLKTFKRFSKKHFLEFCLRNWFSSTLSSIVIPCVAFRPNHFWLYQPLFVLVFRHHVARPVSSSLSSFLKSKIAAFVFPMNPQNNWCVFDVLGGVMP